MTENSSITPEVRMLMLIANTDEGIESEAVQSYIEKHPDVWEKIKKKITTPEIRKKNQLDFSRTNYPEVIFKHHDQIMKNLAGQDPENVLIEVKKGSGKYITGHILTGDIMEHALSKTPLEPDHLLYLEAIHRIWEAGIDLFTPAIIYRFAMVDSKAQITKSKKEDIIRHIDDLRRTIPEINFTELLIQHNKLDKDYDEEPQGIKNNLLYIREVYRERNGKREEWYQLIDEPVLLSVTKELGHYSTQFKWESMEQLKGTSTQDALIYNYLLERVAAMKHRRGIKTRSILVKSVIEKIGLEDPSPRQTRTVRNKTKHALEMWSKDGTIKDYNVIKKGNRIDAYEVVL